MEALLASDQYLFLFFHNLYRSPLLTSIALFLSGVGSFGIVWLLGSLFFFLKEEIEDSQWFFLPILLALGSSLVLVELILKPLVSRIRPSETFGLLAGETAVSGHSFPSGHATLAFAGATVLAAREPKLASVFYFLAILISWSRVYLGVHYPLDIIGGALLGIAIGRCAGIVSNKIERIRSKKKRNKRTASRMHRGH